jgi:hypothetical protein
MTRLLVALACLIGASFLAPEASAAPQTTNAKQVEDAAPVEDYVTRDERCRPQRRGGRMAVTQRCEGDGGGGSAAPAMASGECAPRVAYRGHRRVLLPMRACRPLFAA